MKNVSYKQPERTLNEYSRLDRFYWCFPNTIGIHAEYFWEAGKERPNVHSFESHRSELGLFGFNSNEVYAFYTFGGYLGFGITHRFVEI